LFFKTANPCYCTFLSTSIIFFFLELLVLKMNEVVAVPDLAPKLQDSKYIELAELLLHFRPSGKCAASTYYIHIRIPFNFTELLSTPD
jgi:hypothetical protein